MPSVAEIADALDRVVAAAHRQRAAAAATRPDVNATDLLALDITRRHRTISPGDLARAMQLTPGGTNGVIRRLIEANLIVRSTSPTDRRDVRLTVTRRADRLVTTGVGGWDAQLLESLAKLDGPQATEMMNLLATITEATERRADGLVANALHINDPAHGIPHPVRWG